MAKTIFELAEENYKNFLQPTVRRIPVLREVDEFVYPQIRSELETQKKLNNSLLFKMTLMERQIMKGLTAIDYGHGYDFWNMMEILEGNGYVPAGTGTRFGSGINDISIDESKTTVDATNNAAWKAFCRNPLAKRQVRVTTSHVVGKGYAIWSDCQQVQSIIDETIHNESNRMELAQRELMNRYQMEGGYCVLITMLAPDGETLLREIPNSEIYEIACDQNDSYKIQGIVRYYKKRIWKNLSSRDRTILPPGEYQEIPIPIYEWVPVFDWDNPPRRNTVNSLQDLVFVINPTLSDRKRGLSEFASHLAWLSRLEKLGISRTVLNILQTSIVWLHKVKGDASQIAALKGSIESAGTPPPGSSKIINMEVEEFEPLSPQLHASDAEKDTNLVRSFTDIGSNLNKQTMTGDYGNLSFAGGKQAARDLVRNLEEPQAMHEDGMKRIFVRAIKAAIHYGRIWLIKIKVPKNTTNINQLNLRKVVEWDDDLSSYVKEHYTQLKPEEIAENIGLTVSVVESKISDLKIKEWINNNGKKSPVGTALVRKENSWEQLLFPQLHKAKESVRMGNKKRLEALERCLKKESCWRSRRIHWVELLEVWDDEMQNIIQYVMIKKNESYVDKNIYGLIQVKFPFIQVEDELAQAQAITLDLQNELCTKQTASQKRGYDPNREEEMMLIYQSNGKKELEGDNPYGDPDAHPPEPRNPKSPRSKKPDKDYV